LFSSASRREIELFNAIREDPSVGTMNKILGNLNATAYASKLYYFVLEEPRLGTDEFNRVVNKALENNLKVFHSFGDGKLCIFYYRK